MLSGTWCESKWRKLNNSHKRTAKWKGESTVWFWKKIRTKQKLHFQPRAITTLLSKSTRPLCLSIPPSYHRDSLRFLYNHQMWWHQSISISQILHFSFHLTTPSWKKNTDFAHPRSFFIYVGVFFVFFSFKPDPSDSVQRFNCWPKAHADPTAIHAGSTHPSVLSFSTLSSHRSTLILIVVRLKVEPSVWVERFGCWPEAQNHISFGRQSFLWLFLPSAMSEKPTDFVKRI